MNLLQHLRPAARLSPVSGIEAVVNYGRGKDGLIPLWSGEGDRPTPDFIGQAAVDGIEAGETFYTWQNGIPALREALARYHKRHFGADFSPEDFIVTAGGMQAIDLSIRAIAGEGDEMLYFAPAWPNFPAAAGLAGARPVSVPLEFSDNGWSLDIARVEAAVTPRTRAIFVNTPSNPTGWTAEKETLAAILAIARKHGLWIIADEIYALFNYGGGRAASFVDVMEPEDRIIFVNTFSKNWAMTGWRIGWMRLHPSLGRTFENLIQYSTTGVAPFMQRGGAAALDHGDDFVAGQVEQARKARDMLCDALQSTGRVRVRAPQGAFYLFFAVDGLQNSTEAAFDIIDRARVGLAPGAAFGPEGEGYLRLCFLRRLDHIEEAASRLASWIATR